VDSDGALGPAQAERLHGCSERGQPFVASANEIALEFSSGFFFTG
jgi:hypothetical protein